jgi:hypothetical protein
MNLPVAILAGHVQIFVRPEAEVVRVDQPTAGGENGFEFSVRRVPQNLGLAVFRTGDEQIPAGPDDDPAGTGKSPRIGRDPHRFVTV